MRSIISITRLIKTASSKLASQSGILSYLKCFQLFGIKSHFSLLCVLQHFCGARKPHASGRTITVCRATSNTQRSEMAAADEIFNTIQDAQTTVTTTMATVVAASTSTPPAAAATEAILRAAHALKPPSILHSRNPLVDSIIWLLLLELGAVVYLAFPYELPWRTRIVDAIAHGPAFARLRWVYATLLGVLGYLMCGWPKCSLELSPTTWNLSTATNRR